MIVSDVIDKTRHGNPENINKKLYDIHLSIHSIIHSFIQPFNAFIDVVVVFLTSYINSCIILLKALSFYRD